MSNLSGCVSVTLRHCALVLFLVALGGCSAQTPEDNTVINKDIKTAAWWPIVQCVMLADIQKCLQDQNLRSFIGLDRQGDIEIDSQKGTVTLPGEKPEGIMDVIGDLISNGLSKFFGDDGTETADNNEDDDDDDDDNDLDKDEEDAGELESSQNGDNNNSLSSANSSRTNSFPATVERNMETGRGKKKKKKKQKRRTIIKLILLVVLIKLKILKFLYVFGKFMQFKLVLLVGINTLINVIRLFLEFKKKKSHPVVYYEQAHHQHHYDEHHHVDPFHREEEDKGLLGGLWSRSLIAQPEQAHDLAYHAQRPNYYPTQRPAAPTYSTIT